MTGKEFKDIITGILFTVIIYPPFKDKFFEIIHIIVTLKDQIKDVFIPLWVSCLDASISIWTNKFTFPGWIFIPRKPHPKGNYYHNICC